MNRFWTLFVILAFIAACSEAADQTQTEEEAPVEVAAKEGYVMIDGVKRSELALTMRAMYDQMKEVSDSLDAGQEISTNYLERYKSIHTDHATEPKKIDDTYRGMADHFLMKYEAFEAETNDRVQAFNAMVDACLACHQQKCPGPIKAINKLRVQ